MDQTPNIDLAFNKVIEVCKQFSDLVPRAGFADWRKQPAGNRIPLVVQLKNGRPVTVLVAVWPDQAAVTFRITGEHVHLSDPKEFALPGEVERIGNWLTGELDERARLPRLTEGSQ